jgi:hypothetical protein
MARKRALCRDYKALTQSRSHKERSEIGHGGFPHFALTSLSDLVAP